MPTQNSITIVGGGLAGLALGAALARSRVAVTICEAGRLPRPRVCGEFISGLRTETVERLGLAPHLHSAAENRTTGWHAGGRLRWAAALPAPAPGLSRMTLETRLLEDFLNSKGKLRLNERVAETGDGPGQIWTAGRRADAASPWLGLKMHCQDLRLGHDLELHLGRGGYAGAARIEDGRVNICGLFRIRPEVRGPRAELLPAYLTACGLEKFAERLTRGMPNPASAAAVSGLDFTRTWPEDARVSLGDHLAAIPPYTGHGMALALEHAAAALAPLRQYARGEKSWPETAQSIRAAVRAQTSPRLRWARALHPWLLQPARQTLLLALADTRLLPFKLLYRVTHDAPAAA
ncbi:MAG TPA: NAD(P)-binding protein [Opitutales bacterium]|nr:NAD(P)-binding protein [Opitutales bacterium]